MSQEISTLKALGHPMPEQLARLEGALEETERLYGFYKNQMMVKGGANEKSVSADSSDVGAGDNSQG